MFWVECRVVDVRCGRRRLRAAAMKLHFCFWFILIFGAGGLVLFINLQEPTEMVQNQTPNAKSKVPIQTLGKDLCTEHKGGMRSKPDPRQREEEESFSNPIPPMEFPASERTMQIASNASREPDFSSAKLSKRHRKLLLKSYPQAKTLNSSQGSWERLFSIQNARRQLIKEVCDKYKYKGTKRNIMPQHVTRIFVEDKYKLLYCEVPKAGCSNWKRVLMVLEGLASSTQEIKHDVVHSDNYLRRLDSFDFKGVSKRLQTYTKVLFVREPLERLVSAYRDKFENPNNYYHPVFGRAIISKYRANASKEALSTGSGVTFKEFVKYLLDVHKPVGMDIHWEPVGHLCSPCMLDFDFIGKFETMDADAKFLLHRTGAPANLTFPSFKDRNPNAARTSTLITQHYFAQLNASERQRVYDLYYMDYLMFNYSKPFSDLY